MLQYSLSSEFSCRHCGQIIRAALGQSVCCRRGLFRALYTDAG